MSFNLDHATEVAVRMVKQAGEYSLEHFGKVQIEWKDFEVDHIKGVKKFITQSITPVDLACQRMIVETLIEEGLHKDIGILAEEEDQKLALFPSEARFRWIIDPIDGTFNYATANEKTREELKSRGIELNNNSQLYGVSIGIQEVGCGFVLGVIYLPTLNEIFVAQRGNGATKNGVSLEINHFPDFSEDAAVHINSKSDFVKPFLENWRQPVCTVYSITGIADGKSDCFFARETYLHDIGPASLVLLEAGGFVSDEQGNPFHYSTQDAKGKVSYFVASKSSEFNLGLLKRVGLA